MFHKKLLFFFDQLLSLRKLMQGAKDDPRAPLGGNFRPVQPINARNIRTNVRVKADRVRRSIEKKIQNICLIRCLQRSGVQLFFLQDAKCPTLHRNVEFKGEKEKKILRTTSRTERN